MEERLERIALVTGLVGFVLEALSFVVQALRGNVTNAVVLRILGAVGIVVWVGWVTYVLVRLRKAQQQGLALPQELLEGFSPKEVYFDSTNRQFFEDLKLGPGSDSQGSDLQDAELARVTSDGTLIKVQRLHERFRWVISVIKYKNTAMAPSDRYIPADADPQVQGKCVRWICVEFDGRVEDEPLEVHVRLRSATGEWLRRFETSDERASRNVTISHKSWERCYGVLGPVRADQRCYVSLDIMPGPAGAQQSLFIRDLKIVELRERK